MGENGTSREEGSGTTSFSQLDLTPEERAVLLQCRRHSMIRGMVAGSGVCMLLFWLKAQGRIPSAVNKFPGFFYTMAFFIPFTSGYGSYQKICYQKIMSLENSTLRKAAERYEKEFKNKMAAGRARRQRVPEVVPGPNQRTEPPDSPPPSFIKRPKQEASPLSGEFNEGPSINVQTYNRDKAMLEQNEGKEEQPDAFKGSQAQASPPQETPTKRGRTFDEIREEHRLRNSQQQQYPTSRQSGSGTGDERKRRNKYGDIIEP